MNVVILSNILGDATAATNAAAAADAANAAQDKDTTFQWQTGLCHK